MALEGAVLRLQLLAVYLSARRKPMLEFEFEAPLFTLNVNRPSFAPLFQLPPSKSVALMRNHFFSAALVA